MCGWVSGRSVCGKLSGGRETGERMSVTRLIENRLRMCHEIALLAGDARDENLSHCQLESSNARITPWVAKLSFSDIGSSLAWLALISFGSRSGRDRSQRLQQKLHDFSRRHMSAHVFAQKLLTPVNQKRKSNHGPIVFWPLHAK
jgi:hypothetical protein